MGEKHTTARMSIAGEQYEILVKPDAALNFKMGKIIIEAKHGVRQYSSVNSYKGVDIAMTLYVVSISISDINFQDFSQVSINDIFSFCNGTVSLTKSFRACTFNPC